MSTPLKLFERLHEEFRRRHYAYETEKSYTRWIKEFIQFHHMTPPRDLGRENRISRCVVREFGLRSTHSLVED